jgi:hypothetical protein
MNTTRKWLSRHFQSVTGVFGLTLACLLANAQAQTNDEPKILFLHLQLKTNSVSFIKSSTRPGHLKPRPNDDIPDGLHFELTDGDGRPLWHGVIEDPGSRSVEYEDPPGSGKLKRKKFHSSETEFTVRVPVLAKARQIEFYTCERAGSGKDEQRKSRGSLALPAP